MYRTILKIDKVTKNRERERGEKTKEYRIEIRNFN